MHSEISELSEKRTAPAGANRVPELATYRNDEGFYPPERSFDHRIDVEYDAQSMSTARCTARTA